MKVRLLAALVGLAIIVPAILWGGPIAVEVIVVIAGLLCLDEYRRMAFPDDPAAMVWLVAGSAAVFAAAVHADGRFLGAALGVAVLGSFAVPLFRPGPDLRAGRDAIGKYLVGIAWIGGLLSFLPLLRGLQDGIAWIFLVLAIPWLGDTGAYFAGRAFGRRKLYPLVSPKKTWEGLVGGIIVTIVGVFAVRHLGLPTLPAADCVALGALLGGAAVVGDLSESLVKRAFDVKDSGRIMPGHGGLLDRVDSLLFVAPLLHTYATVVRGWS